MERLELIARLCKIAGEHGFACSTCGSPWPWEDLFYIVSAIANGTTFEVDDYRGSQFRGLFASDDAFWSFVTVKE